MTLVVVTMVWLLVNAGLTVVTKASLVQNQEFWILQVRILHDALVTTVSPAFSCHHPTSHTIVTTTRVMSNVPDGGKQARVSQCTTNLAIKRRTEIS